jgi:glucose/arabinose dehydrogenase
MQVLPDVHRDMTRIVLCGAAALVLGLAGCGQDQPAAPAATSAGPTAGQSPGATTERPPVPEVQVAGDVVTGIEVPWGLDFLPGGDALVTERDTRRILRLTPDGRLTPVGEVPEAEGDGEGGLLGLAISPTYDTDRLVYVYFSTSTENRIERMTYDGTALGPREPLVTGIPSAVYHDGGALEFGPDGLLYAGTGDATDGPLAQDRSSLAGKVLRMTPDGAPAPGNPFPDSVVYSLGHRNVQGLAWDSRNRLWAAEYGADAWDELNMIEPGGNYGWPQVEGRGDGPFRQPAAVWPVAENSPSGIAIVDDVVYMAATRGERLWRIPIADDGAGEPVAALQGEYGRLRTVEQAPDGSLWVTTTNRDGRAEPRPADDRILRVRIS